jgi:hypothetical protein
MQLRVGIHSGPIIVGVHYVGNRIPRLLKKKKMLTRDPAKISLE